MTDIPVIWIVVAIVIGIVVLKRFLERGRYRGSNPTGGVDVEADLLRACRGDRAMAERLLAHELERNENLSRPGAALMALAKLRDDQR
jgi:hypothetical protein